MMERFFAEELIRALPGSSGAERKAWAKIIASENMDLLSLCRFVFQDQKATPRMLWMLTDIGEKDPAILGKALPEIWRMHADIGHTDIRPYFAKYWHLHGVDPEQEGEAVSLLFDWIRNPSFKLYLKAQAVRALAMLIRKHPDLEGEFRMVLEEQMDRHSAHFRGLCMHLLNDPEKR